jgi:GNAT superfamily N-acetyltransferase
MKIQLISRNETFELRHRVLRPSQPQSAVEYKEDLRPGTFHLGALIDSAIVGVATFTPEAVPSILPPAMQPFRLRGMAVDPLMKRQGVGRQILLTAEQRLIKLNCDLLWFNAREAAFQFYESLDFEYAGDLFEIEPIGPHKVMYKRFNL